MLHSQPPLEHPARTGLRLALAALIGLAAFAASALIVVPAPNHPLALLAVALSEKSFVPGLGGLIAVVLALRLLGSPLRSLAAAVALLGLVAVGIALIPPVQAIRIARARGITLDPFRYLTAPIERDVRHPAHSFVYATIEGRALSLDVYPAANAGSADETQRRAILLVHGGGWSAGDRGETSRNAAWLAAQGHHVFDLDYRLAPGTRWKGMIGDIKCAIGWIKSHARLTVGDRTIVIDPARIALLGRSAGGHLALLAGFTAGDPGLPSSCGADDSSVDAIVALYAPTDLVWGYAHPSRMAVYDTSAKLRDLMGGTPEQFADDYERASPSRRVHAGVPPVLLMHGGRDQLVSPLHMQWLTGPLQAQGIPWQQLEIPYAEHGFDYVWGGLSGQLAEAALGRFLTEVDGRKPPTPSPTPAP